MRHPFDGIVSPRPQTRRSWLGTALASIGALIGSRLFGAAPTTAKVVVEPEPNPEPTPKPKPVTLARIEEGQATTNALNEEGGAVTKALNENGLTRALNENGKVTQARRENGGGFTTLAVGEEGAKK